MTNPFSPAYHAETRRVMELGIKGRDENECCISCGAHWPAGESAAARRRKSPLRCTARPPAPASPSPRQSDPEPPVKPAGGRVRDLARTTAAPVLPGLEG